MTGIIALVLCLAAIPICVLGGTFAFWNVATVLVPAFFMEIIALVLGIAGRKSIAGKVAMIGSAVLLLVLAAWPTPFTVTAKGTLEPVKRQDIFANIDGVVEELKVDHGDHVAKGQLLVKLRNTELELTIADMVGKERVNSEKISRVRRELLEPKLSPEVRTRLERERSELSQTQESLERQLRLLKDRQSEFEVRCPLDGVVLTWDLRNRLSHRPVQRGQILLQVADLTGPYQLELQVPEDRVGRIAEAQVAFVMATDPGIVFQGGAFEIVARSAECRDDYGNTVLMKVAVDKSKLPNLRPGVSVIARVNCGSSRLACVVLQEVIQWVKAGSGASPGHCYFSSSTTTWSMTALPPALPSAGIPIRNLTKVVPSGTVMSALTRSHSIRSPESFRSADRANPRYFFPVSSRHWTTIIGKVVNPLVRTLAEIR